MWLLVSGSTLAGDEKAAHRAGTDGGVLQTPPQSHGFVNVSRLFAEFPAAGLRATNSCFATRGCLPPMPSPVLVIFLSVLAGTKR